MKIIVCGDLHFRGDNPRSRTDNFMEALQAKMFEVADIARENDASNVIIPGDVFNSPNVSWSVVAHLGALMQSMERFNRLRFLVINGNHDIFGGFKGGISRTPLGLLSRLGIVYDLEEPCEFNEEWHGEDVCITGCGFDTNTDSGTEAGMAQFDPPPHVLPYNGVSIHVVHSMLMLKSPGYDMRHTLIDDVQTTANVIISGHHHIGFGIHRRKDGVLFINPGALCRQSADIKEIERTVQVALLTIENGHAEAELIPLTSARPGHEVLDRSQIEAQAERNERMDTFLALLANTGEQRYLETQEIVANMAAQEKLPETVKAEALKRIAAAQEKLRGRGAA